jgi:hypothetical protein
MLAWLKGSIKDGTEDFGKKVVVLVLMAIGGIALTWWTGVWPHISRWLFGTDPEVARQAVIILVVVLDLLVLVFPTRRLPIKVTAIGGIGAEAVLCVENHGKKGSFFVKAQVIAFLSPSKEISRGNLPLEPAWLPGGLHSSTSLHQHEIGRLRLAGIVPQRHASASAIYLEDVGAEQPRLIEWSVGEGDGPAVKIRVTIWTDEQRLIRLVRPTKPFSAEYTIVADVHGNLSVEPGSFLPLGAG